MGEPVGKLLGELVSGGQTASSLAAKQRRRAARPKEAEAKIVYWRPRRSNTQSLYLLTRPETEITERAQQIRLPPFGACRFEAIVWGAGRRQKWAQLVPPLARLLACSISRLLACSPLNLSSCLLGKQSLPLGPSSNFIFESCQWRAVPRWRPRSSQGGEAGSK